MTIFQTVEEIEGVLGRDLYPNLTEERSRWEKELAGLREENESLTAMLCSKEEELNRTKATMNAIREERDRLRRRVSMLPDLAWVGGRAGWTDRAWTLRESQSWDSLVLTLFIKVVQRSLGVELRL